MIESHYSMNVATGGRHYCRIHLGGYKVEALEKADLIRKAFGAAFECTVTYIECIGHPVALKF